MYPHNELIDFTLLAQGIFSFCFLISAFSVASNEYAGFVAVLSGFMFSGFTGVSHYGISYKPSGIFYGAILGSSVILVFVTLMSAIFWGQYGGCSSYEAAIYTTPDPSSFPTSLPTSSAPTMHSFQGTRAAAAVDYGQLVGQLDGSQIMHKSRQLYGVRCSSTSGMKSCCAFSVFLMLTYMFFVTILFRFKNEILTSVGTDEQYSAVAHGESTHSTLNDGSTNL